MKRLLALLLMMGMVVCGGEFPSPNTEKGDTHSSRSRARDLMRPAGIWAI